MLKCNEWEITFNMLIVTCQGNKTKSKQFENRETCL